MGSKNWQKSRLQTVQHDGIDFEYEAVFVETLRIKQISYQNIAELLTPSSIIEHPITSTLILYFFLYKQNQKNLSAKN